MPFERLSTSFSSMHAIAFSLQSGQTSLRGCLDLGEHFCAFFLDGLDDLGLVGLAVLRLVEHEQAVVDADANGGTCSDAHRRAHARANKCASGTTHGSPDSARPNHASDARDNRLEEGLAGSLLDNLGPDALGSRLLGCLGSLLARSLLGRVASNTRCGLLGRLGRRLLGRTAYCLGRRHASGNTSGAANRRADSKALARIKQALRGLDRTREEVGRNSLGGGQEPLGDSDQLAVRESLFIFGFESRGLIDITLQGGQVPVMRLPRRS